jgi:hypothetical protein
MPTIQPSAFAVVATHLAQTDRRTLSQAWFDALHLARERSPRAEHAQRTPQERSTRAEGRARCSEERMSDRMQIHRASKNIRTDDRSQRPIGRERRIERSELSRRIERAVVRRTPASLSSMVIRTEDGRVQLLVRSDGQRTRIVALCLPAQRVAVEAALAHARFALARRGIAVDADVRSVI